MSTKNSIVIGENFHLYFDDGLDSVHKNVHVSITDPSTYLIERTNQCLPAATISIKVKDMDQIALAWIKERGILE